MKKVKSHLHPLVNQDVVISQRSEPLNFVKGVLETVMIEIVAAVNQISHETRWINRTRSKVF